ncbi:FAD/NAD(P)-binding protein [Streptomyces sp. ODS28]|uniref:FAD/NAD(P)-binding protein n=1 Tax=Streptomyces sp. ODS28 TaxID=3136688 RepID=UPI0031E67B66
MPEPSRSYPPSPCVAVVGAGPRGASVVERLCASAPELLGPGERLTLHVIDPHPPGAGRVWRTDQSGELLMNTVASQITLFTDDSVAVEGPVRPGPSLYEWDARRRPGALGPDDYPPRALYGAYLEWAFAEVVRGAPGQVTVRVHAAHAVRLTDGPGASRLQELELSDGTRLSGLSSVVLTQGHLPAEPSREQRRLTAYARRHGLHYLPPANPADLTAELAALAPGSPVLLRGLGLTFFDHMALLTTGRGGRFERTRTGLAYRPSGREPLLYAGSRRGIPYHARGDNEKGAHGRHHPLLLTPEVIAGFRARTAAGSPPDFLAEVWPLIAKEVETVYYETLLGRPHPLAFRARFLHAPHGGPEERLLLEESGIPDSLRWDWQRLSRPHAGRTFTGPADFHSWLLTWLHEDVRHAREGNVRGPVKAALDVLRDLRNELRLVVDHGGLGAESRRDHLDRWYTPLNAFLSIGPPRRRVEETAALIEAGVLEVLGPDMEVRAAGGSFAAHSPAVPGSAVRAPALIEARLPEPDLRRTADPLLRHLLRTGGCRPHAVYGYETGGLDVTPAPCRIVDARGRAHPRRFALGVPTEGAHWVTAAGARPGVNSATLTDTDAAARAALLTSVRGGGAYARTGPATGAYSVTG